MLHHGRQGLMTGTPRCDERVGVARRDRKPMDRGNGRALPIGRAERLTALQARLARSAYTAAAAGSNGINARG